jgi:hypothetical protein
LCAKLPFNHNHHSTSHFKNWSRSRKVNSFLSNHPRTSVNPAPFRSPSDFRPQVAQRKKLTVWLNERGSPQMKTTRSRLVECLDLSGTISSLESVRSRGLKHLVLLWAEVSIALLVRRSTSDKRNRGRTSWLAASRSEQDFSSFPEMLLRRVGPLKVDDCIRGRRIEPRVGEESNGTPPVLSNREESPQPTSIAPRMPRGHSKSGYMYYLICLEKSILNKADDVIGKFRIPPALIYRHTTKRHLCVQTKSL